VPVVRAPLLPTLFLSPPAVSISWLHTCTPAHELPQPSPVAPPIMALSPDLDNVSPGSAATSNAPFQRDSFCLNLSALPDSSGFMLKSSLRSPHLLDSPNGLFSPSSGMTGSATYRKRPRNMSQSSGTDREMSINGTPPAQSQAGSTAPTSHSSVGEPRPSNKKRPSTDTIDYPRRRATIAVWQNYKPPLRFLC
jgi:hypothetical protein